MTQASYSGISRLLHWLIAGLILLVLIPVGLTMVSLDDGAPKNTLYELHKSFGLIVFTLAVIRVAVRAIEGFPALPADVPAWQRIAARVTHFALYVLIVAVPVLGFTGTSMCCAPVKLFWTVPVPLEFPGGAEMGERVLWWHKTAVFALASIVTLHVVGALHHLLVRRDGVFQRMARGTELHASEGNARRSV